MYAALLLEPSRSTSLGFNRKERAEAHSLGSPHLQTILNTKPNMDYTMHPSPGSHQSADDLRPRR